MKKLTIRNDFHNSETTIDTSRALTARRVRDIRNRLCGISGCCCGDTLGARGPQDDDYEAFLERAIAVLYMGKIE